MSYYYGREIGFGGRLTKTIKYLILLNLIVFVSKYLVSESFYLGLLQTFGLTPALCLNKLMLWQLSTYLFIHTGFWQLLINMFILWMFGSDVEEELGSKYFLAYYLFCGLGAGIGYLLIAQTAIPLLGAAGSILGVLLAFGVLFPERVITLLLLLVFPVRIKAKYLVTLFIGIELLMLLEEGPGQIGRFAALGGILFGYLYLKKREAVYNIIDKYFSFNFKKRQRVRLKIIKPNFKRKKRVSSSTAIEGSAMKTEEQIDKEIFISKEIDPILDKISKKGIHSLSKEEKEKLEKAKHLIK